MFPRSNSAMKNIILAPYGSLKYLPIAVKVGIDSKGSGG
jgi:hypothetical protein